MTLNQLEYFRKVATLQHYRLASEELNISQPSLSRSMALLEDEFQLILFEKQGRNVVLTKAGRILLEHVNRILDEVASTQHKMKQIAENGGHIDIAYVYPLANSYIPHTVRSFLNMEANKEVTFSFNQSHTSSMIAGLKADEHDIIFGSYVENEPNIAFIPILHQDMVIITPKGHPLSAHTSVSIRELEHYPVIGYDRYSGLGNFIQDFYYKNSLKISTICDCPDENAISAMVSENFGIALVAHTDTITPEKVDILEINDVPLEHTVYMGFVKGKYQLPAVRRFIDFIRHQE